jgi:hypothetical protein
MKTPKGEDLARFIKNAEARERQSLDAFLRSAQVPLTRDERAAFFKELGASKRRIDFDCRKRRFASQVAKSDFSADDFQWALTVSLMRNVSLDRELAGLEAHLQAVGEAGGVRQALHANMRRTREQDARKARDRKAEALLPADWTQPLTVASLRAPVDYARATGQRRKVIEAFLEKIQARPLPPDNCPRLAGRGKPPEFYGPRTNCAVLDQWLGKWHPQKAEVKAETVLDQVLEQAIFTGDPRRVAAVAKVLRRHLTDCAKRLPPDSKLQDCCRFVIESAFPTAAKWAVFAATCQETRQRHRQEREAEAQAARTEEARQYLEKMAEEVRPLIAAREQAAPPPGASALPPASP